jgi:hypothetical protein
MLHITRFTCRSYWWAHIFGLKVAEEEGDAFQPVPNAVAEDCQQLSARTSSTTAHNLFLALGRARIVLVAARTPLACP